MLLNIPSSELIVKINDLWLNRWLLLTSGDLKKEEYNTMTVAWGFLGVMWNKPCAVAVVRPTRYTYGFMEKYPSFTLTSFSEKFRSDLEYLGNVSGRDVDKLSRVDLTICPSKEIEAPSFEEAELSIECKQIYKHDFDPKLFLDKSLDSNYPLKDYHKVYYGEIISLSGDKEFMKK